MISDLHLAAQRGDLAEIQKLVAAGTDINTPDLNGNTPLKYAAAEPFPETLKLLRMALS